MTNPKVSKEEMLELLDDMIEESIRSSGDYGEFPLDPESERSFREHVAPLRSAIEERERLRKAIQRWKERWDKLPRWDMIGMADWILEVQTILDELRDFKLDGEEK